MALENSGGDIILPAELQKRIDLTKKQVAINEQELITLQKARIAEEYAVRELLKRKDSIEKDIEVAEKIKEATKSNSARLTEENVGLVAENERLVAEFDVLKAKNDKETEFTDARAQEVARRETVVTDREIKVAVREKNCMAQETKHGKFQTKLSEALKEL
jgi:hypothetical protein